jgi:acyl dehydratase
MYRDSEGQLLVPHTYFATWGLAELAKSLVHARLPLNFARVIQAGSRVRIHRMQRVSEPSRFSATVETVVRTGKRVRIEQQLTTMTLDGVPLATHTLALVLPDRDAGSFQGNKPETVPLDSRSISTFSLSPSTSWRYARLSGDFNPMHWFSPFAKLIGFDAPIAHGFHLMARTCHAAIEHLAQGNAQRLRKIDISFRKPIPLPTLLHLYATQPQSIQPRHQRVAFWVAPQQQTIAPIAGHLEIEP